MYAFRVRVYALWLVVTLGTESRGLCALLDHTRRGYRCCVGITASVQVRCALVREKAVIDVKGKQHERIDAVVWRPRV